MSTRSSFARCLAPLAIALAVAGCGNGGGGGPPASNDVWDIDKDGIPKFVEVSYLELDKIARISRFRSGEGHDYSDAFEHCRSMKHYFEPRASVDWASIQITSPVTGKITRADQEWAGTKLEIQSDSKPAFRFVIFHVNLTTPLAVGDPVVAGRALGNHIGSQTMSDIAVMVNDPTRQGRMISYFEVMTDAAFQAYIARGMASRAEAIISKAERDAAPLSCNGDVFADPGTIPNWCVLN
jgi:hypothetical protein